MQNYLLEFKLKLKLNMLMRQLLTIILLFIKLGILIVHLKDNSSRTYAKS